MANPPQARCPACGYHAAVVYVHGHGQCARCGTNTEPCCQPDALPNDGRPETHPAEALRSPILAHVPHAFATRNGGVSRGIFASLNFGNPGDLPAAERDPLTNIRANYALLLEAAGAAGRTIVEVHQVHGEGVHVVRRGEPAHASPADTKADAIVTDDPARVIAIRTADCAPILLASADGAVVAAVHAGWRGVVAGVLPKAIAAMHELGGLTAAPGTIRAAIGPCISVDHFEVGPEVAAAFLGVFGDDPAILLPHRGKARINLKAALERQCREAGLTDVHTFHACTVRDAGEFFSHRRDAGRTGRMASLIGPR